ncbi:hypothetical protein JCM9279_001287 [Rhodotorula babjevae]
MSSDAHGPSARSPPSSPRVVARDLPYELLHTIFRLASTPSSTTSSTTSRPPHGGAVRSWHSFEPAARLSLVCRRWRTPAQAVLFSSVALVGREPAQAFLEALEGSERVRQLAKQETTFVVLALDAVDEQQPPSSPTPCEPPIALGRQKRDRPLVTLVLGPTNVAARRWSEGLWDIRDGWDVRPEVENLEHTGLLAQGPASLPTSLRVFPQLALRRLKLRHDWPIDILAAALKNSPQLELVDLYFEQDKPAQALYDALRVSCKNLRDVRYIYNPTSSGPDSGDSSSSQSPPPSYSPRRSETSSPDRSSSSPSARTPRTAPLFDLLLPHLTSLRTLHCTSTDLTPSALLALPASLQSISIKSLNSLSRFSPRALLAVLRDPHLALPDGFDRLTVTDNPDDWGQETIDEARLRCEEVGVRFEFRMDFEEEGEYESD